MAQKPIGPARAWATPSMSVTVPPLSRAIGFVGNWLNIALYGWLIYEMLSLWLAPESSDALRVLTLAVMMGMEFIMGHSGVFMAVLRRSWSMILLVPIYGLFAWGFSNYVPGNEMMWIYFGVIAMRMRFAFSKPTEAQINKNILMSISTVMTYFFLIFIFAFNAERLPAFGLTTEFLTASGYHDLHDSGGIFIDTPHVALAMGVVYFSFLALWEVLIYGLIPKGKSQEKSGRNKD